MPKELGEISNAVAVTGYFSKANIDQCMGRAIDPIISTAREKHNSFLETVCNRAANGQKDEPLTGRSPVDKMNQILKSEKGSHIYKNRKQTVEPVFGIIKEILGIRRFSLRGEQKTNGEWSLICTAFNLKRMFNLSVG